MTDRTERQLLRTWLALLGLTGASVAAVRFAGPAATAALALCLAMFKARFVTLDFLGLRRQPAMRRALVGWCVVLAAAAAAKAVLVTVLGS